MIIKQHKSNKHVHMDLPTYKQISNCIFFFKTYTNLLNVLDEQTQNPRGDHVVERSKFGILEPQQVRAKKDQFVYVVKTTPMLK